LDTTCRLSVHNAFFVAKRYVVRESAIVGLHTQLLDRAMATFYRLSKITMSLSAAVWPQFRMQCCLL